MPFGFGPMRGKEEELPVIDKLLKAGIDKIIHCYDVIEDIILLQ